MQQRSRHCAIDFDKHSIKPLSTSLWSHWIRPKPAQRLTGVIKRYMPQGVNRHSPHLHSRSRSFLISKNLIQVNSKQLQDIVLLFNLTNLGKVTFYSSSRRNEYFIVFAGLNHFSYIGASEPPRYHFCESSAIPFTGTKKGCVKLSLLWHVSKAHSIDRRQWPNVQITCLCVQNS